MDAKKAIILVVVALLLFYIITQPNDAADQVQQVLVSLRHAAEAIITFLRRLFA